MGVAVGRLPLRDRRADPLVLDRQLADDRPLPLRNGGDDRVPRCTSRPSPVQRRRRWKMQEGERVEAREPAPPAAHNPRAVLGDGFGTQLDVPGHAAGAVRITSPSRRPECAGPRRRLPHAAALGYSRCTSDDGAQVLACTVVTMAFAVFGELIAANRGIAMRRRTGRAPRAQRDAERARARGVALPDCWPARRAA